MKKMVLLLMVMIMAVSSIPFGAVAENKEEPVTLNVFYASSRPMNDATEMTRQWIEDNLGVNIQLTQGDSSNFAQQLALYISSGDMPDVVWLSYKEWAEYMEEGAWADISPYYKEHENLQNYVGEYWNYVSSGEGVYGVPSMLNVPSSHITAIRKDWLDKLGLEIPVTLDEYTEVMRQFTFNDPDGDGQNNTFGISGEKTDKLSFLVGAFGASTNQDYFLNEDGTVTTNAISEEYKAGLQYLRDIYAEGLIDPEMFTTTYEQAQAKWGRGEMGIWECWWSHPANAYIRFDYGTLQPQAKVDVIMPPVGEEGKSGNLSSDPLDMVVGISYLCDETKVKAALKLLDFEASPYGFRVVQYGVEDEFFTWDKEKNMTTWTWSLSDNKSKSGIETTDMEVYKMLYHEDINAQTFELGDDIHLQMLAKGSQMRYEEPVHEDIFGLINTEELVSYSPELNTYFTENMLAFIMGEKDIDTQWDSYVDTYLSMGGEEVRQSLLKKYNELNKTNYTFK